MSDDWNAEHLEDTLDALRENIAHSPCLVIADPEHLPPQTQLIVTCGGGTIEFTILDSRECKVTVNDGRGEPAEGKSLGTKTRPDASTPDTFMVSDGQLLPGRLLRLGCLAYEVGGQEHNIDAIRGIRIVQPSGVAYDLWGD